MDLLTKLRIKKDVPLVLLNCPANCLYLFEEAIITERTPAGQLSQVVVFALDSAVLTSLIPALQPEIGTGTLLWICYPKKSGSIASDLYRNEGWEIVFASGFRGQSSAAIDDDWTGMRFTNAPKTTSSICDLPQEERKVEGIDYINRTVQLPDDALEVVREFAGIEEVFNKMSFTHKKEYVLSIVEAKKPETRQKRILKMVEMLDARMRTKK